MSHAFTVAQLQAALASAKPPLVLDVRRAPTFHQAAGLIIGAVWCDPERIDEWFEVLDRERPVVAYCVHGQQVSQSCSQMLGDLGFDAVFLEGGIEAWISTGGQITVNTGVAK